MRTWKNLRDGKIPPDIRVAAKVAMRLVRLLDACRDGGRSLYNAFTCQWRAASQFLPQRIPLAQKAIQPLLREFEGESLGVIRCSGIADTSAFALVLRLAEQTADLVTVWLPDEPMAVDFNKPTPLQNFLQCSPLTPPVEWESLRASIQLEAKMFAEMRKLRPKRKKAAVATPNRGRPSVARRDECWLKEWERDASLYGSIAKFAITHKVPANTMRKALSRAKLARCTAKVVGR